MWKILSETVERKQYMSILTRTLQKPDGTECVFEIVQEPDGVYVLAVTPEMKIVVIREFRPAIMQYIYGFPVGNRDNNEPAEETAKRELREEAGYTADRFTLLTTTYPSGRLSSKDIVYFCKARQVGKPKLEAHEDITVQLMKPKEFEAIMAKEPVFAPVRAAYLVAKERGLLPQGF
jgi:ADP-ribose pyrophosphatase